MGRRIAGIRDVLVESGRCQECRGTGKHDSGGACVVCTAPRERPTVERPCVMRLTATPRSNGRLLRVRCECMSGVAANRPVDVRTPYDHLGDVASLGDAWSMWRAHVTSSRT